jgi:hypothetical protein
MFKSFSRVFVLILSSVLILNTLIFSTVSVDAKSKVVKKATKSVVSKKKPVVTKPTKSKISPNIATTENTKSTNNSTTEQPNYIEYKGNGLGDTKCADGTTSRSAGRGTCSKHGGIAK